VGVSVPDRNDEGGVFDVAFWPACGEGLDLGVELDPLHAVLVGVAEGRPLPAAASTANNFAKHLEALRWRTPCQVICEAWTKDPSTLTIDPRRLIPGPHN